MKIGKKADLHEKLNTSGTGLSQVIRGLKRKRDATEKRRKFDSNSREIEEDTKRKCEFRMMESFFESSSKSQTYTSIDGRGGRIVILKVVARIPATF